jgi:hypothetical protein
MNQEISTNLSFVPSARRFLGYAVHHDAAKLYQEIGTPLPNNLARHTTLYLTKKGFDDGAYSAENMMNLEDRVILTNAIRDVKLIFETSLDEHRPSEVSEALEIIKHPTTTHSMARLALRDEKALLNLIELYGHHTDNRLYGISEDLTHLAWYPQLATANKGGCPMAGHHGEVVPDPLFGRFVSWAGELAVRSLYLHRYKKDTI